MGFWAFYGLVLRQLPRLWHKRVGQVAAATTTLATVVLVFNRQLSQWIMEAQGIHPAWAIVVVIGGLGWAFLVACHRAAMQLSALQGDVRVQRFVTDCYAAADDLKKCTTTADADRAVELHAAARKLLEDGLGRTYARQFRDKRPPLPHWTKPKSNALVWSRYRVAAEWLEDRADEVMHGKIPLRPDYSPAESSSRS